MSCELFPVLGCVAKMVTILLIFFTAIIAFALLYYSWPNDNYSETSLADAELQGRTYQGVQETKSQNVVAIDCETVKCSPSEDWPTVRSRAKEVTLAVHCALVDYNYKVLYEEFIRPPPNSDVTNWMGFHDDSYRERIKKSVLFSKAREEILNKLRGKIVVAHDFHHDFYSLNIKGKIQKKDIRDTSTCDMLRIKLLEISPDKSHNKRMKLKDLAKHILHKTIQKTTPHNPVEDAMAAMELYRDVEDEWEASILETETK